MYLLLAVRCVYYSSFFSLSLWSGLPRFLWIFIVFCFSKICIYHLYVYCICIYLFYWRIFGIIFLRLNNAISRPSTVKKLFSSEVVLKEVKQMTRWLIEFEHLEVSLGTTRQRNCCPSLFLSCLYIYNTKVEVVVVVVVVVHSIILFLYTVFCMSIHHISRP